MMSDWEEAKVSEPFVCTECGRKVAPFVDYSGMHICATCIVSPGWHKNLRLAKRLDPKHERKVPRHEVE
jgi:hypothetical protein